jgi:hypothetical protein
MARGSQIKKKAMEDARSMRSDMRNENQMLVGKPEGRDHYGELCVGGSILLKCCEGVDWIVMARDRFQDQSVMARWGSIEVPKKEAHLLTR